MKDLKQYLDIYGLPLVAEMFKIRGFYLFSYSKKSIPSAGSPCKNIDEVEFGDVPINQMIEHKDGSITLKTEFGNLRFWR